MDDNLKFGGTGYNTKLDEDSQTVFYFSDTGERIPTGGPSGQDIVIGLLILAGMWLLFRLMGVH